MAELEPVEGHVKPLSFMVYASVRAYGPVLISGDDGL